MVNYKLRLGSGTTLTSVKTQLVDLVKTSDTTFEDTDLSIDCVVGKSYHLDGTIVISSSATPDSKSKIDNDTCVFLKSQWFQYIDTNIAVAKIALTATPPNPAGTTNEMYHLSMDLIQCTTGGKLTYQFAQAVSNGVSAILRQGSYWIITEMKYA